MQSVLTNKVAVFRFHVIRLGQCADYIIQQPVCTDDLMMHLYVLVMVLALLAMLIWGFYFEGGAK